MAKFESKKTDLVVSCSSGSIKFIKGFYTTTKKTEIEALKKALNVSEVGAEKAPIPQQKENKKESKED